MHPAVNGGLCSSGSSLLWRTFLDPALNGATPMFSANICKSASVWIGGVPCSALPASLIDNDWQTTNPPSSWGGTT